MCKVRDPRPTGKLQNAALFKLCDKDGLGKPCARVRVWNGLSARVLRNSHIVRFWQEVIFSLLQMEWGPAVGLLNASIGPLWRRRFDLDSVDCSVADSPVETSYEVDQSSFQSRARPCKPMAKVFLPPCPFMSPDLCPSASPFCCASLCPRVLTSPFHPTCVLASAYVYLCSLHAAGKFKVGPCQLV